MLLQESPGIDDVYDVDDDDDYAECINIKVLVDETHEPQCNLTVS